MKALRFFKGQGLILTDSPVPEVKEGEVLLKVLACSICGSDVRVLKGEKEPKRDGVTLGHEISGVVAKSRNPMCKEDELVAVFPSIFCRKCGPCLSGRTNLCRNKLTFGSSLDGGFAQYMLIPERLVEQGGLVPVRVDPHIACLIEPLSCVLNSFEALNPPEGTSMLIIGAGPLGLMHLCLAKHQKLKATIVDRNNHRLETAKRIYPEVKTYQSVKDVRESFEVAVLCAFAPQELDTVIGLMKEGGRVNIFAGGNWQQKATITPNAVHYRELVITGTHSTKPHLFKRASELIEDLAELRDIVTHRFPLEDYQEAFNTYTTRKGLKVVLEPNTSP